MYNAGQYLEEALDSILAQTFEDFELIISDNGSTDNTEAICWSYVRRDQRIRYFRSATNMGAAWNFNRVFELATGKYFKWTAHDDQYAPNYLARLVEVFEKAPAAVVLCYPKTTLIDKDGNAIKIYEDKLDLREASAHQRLLHFFREVWLCNAVYGLIRPAALRQTRGLDKFVGADRILLMELALLGEFWEIPEPLFLRRRHPGSSGGATRSFLEVAVWFDPSNRRRHDVYPANRWFVEYLKSIKNAPISGREKLRCARIFFGEWYLKQNWRNLGGEWKIALKHLLNLQKHPMEKSGMTNAALQYK
ncbi:MAG: hypothetical protein ALAOOOJD_01103 [bacterium]|nr:hypothetical protein [bacterium]